MLSTRTEPEASAIRTAVPATRLGVALKVFRPDHLAAIKFLAGRGKDLVDFDGLVARGVREGFPRYASDAEVQRAFAARFAAGAAFTPT